ncbi:hypothetical protein RHOSPDRAFT_31707 [Rhodotorula sp. JG-1b]|nr:hypothetical protein RHOSPDRAFT_31707 [Rhodotorula sp. JG-1b]
MSRQAPVYGPFVLAPPLTSCESAFLVFGQGTPPYSIAVAGTADSNFTALETLPTQSRAGVVEWHVDFDEGANLTFVLTDGEGQHAYSPYRVVQPGTVSTCPRGQPKKSSSNHAGAIAGGIIGALVLALVVLTSLWNVRRARRRVAMQAAAERDAQYAAHVAIHADKDNDDTPLGEGAASVVRAGTFNLGAVRFTEDSLDHLRAIDRPPAYDRPPPPPPPIPASVPGLSSASSPSSSAAPSASPPPPPSPPLPNRPDDEIRELPRL